MLASDILSHYDLSPIPLDREQLTAPMASHQELAIELDDDTMRNSPSAPWPMYNSAPAPAYPLLVA